MDTGLTYADDVLADVLKERILGGQPNDATMVAVDIARDYAAKRWPNGTSYTTGPGAGVRRSFFLTHCGFRADML